MSANTDTGTGSDSRIPDVDVSDHPLRKRAVEEKQKRDAERRQVSAMQRSIENYLAEETITLPLGPEEVQFSTLNGTDSDKATLIGERIARIGGDDFEEQFEDEVWWMCETLGGAAEPEWFTADWVKQNLSIRKRRKYLNMLTAERDLTSEQIKNLESQGVL